MSASLRSVPPPPDLRERLDSAENAVADALVEMQESNAKLEDKITALTAENAQLRADHDREMARAWKAWGWQTTLLALVAIAANIVAANIWRLDKRDRYPTPHHVGAGPSAPGVRRGASAGADGAGPGEAHP
jgi:regulator of protease activity HflC (stomatin/prohibitin superfamily)